MNQRSLLHYFKPALSESIITVALPSSDDVPNIPLGTLAAVNDAVADIVVAPPPRKRKMSNEHYDAVERLKMAKLANELGLSVAKKKILKETGHCVAISTLQSMRDSFNASQKTVKEDLLSMPKFSGRPTTLPNAIDEKIRMYLDALSRKGGCVTNRIVQCIGRAITTKEWPDLLFENGGGIFLGRNWVKSMMTRMNLVRRKGTRSAKADFVGSNEIKIKFVQHLAETMQAHVVPPSFVINFDQLGARLVPVGDWTMAKRGSKQVTIDGLGDKREITVTMGSVMSGELLPLQLIYQGKTEQCHPVLSVPPGWDITHSENHWANDKTLRRYIEYIVIPYAQRVKSTLHLPEEHPAIIILDVYK